MATLSTLATFPVPFAPPTRREERRIRRGLLIALALSLAVHIAWSFWPVAPAEPPEATVLSATLTEMPAPPKPVPAPAARKPVQKPFVAPSASAPAAEIATPAEATQRAESARPDTPAAAAGTEAPSISEGPLDTPEPPTLPPRLDLQYKVFLGTEDFWIGSATYRFEHEGNRYSIATVAQARGLAALIVRGRGKVESRGIITRTGLQPLEFAVERGSADRREVAHFDWESGVVTLHEDKTAGLDAPTYDPLTLMWQPYFSPPVADEESFSVATTRRVTRYTVTREGRERIAWSGGEVDAERWHRVSDDGRTDAYVWLAPSLRYVPVMARISQTLRGTLLIVLDGIRVDGVQTGTGEAATLAHDDAAARTSGTPPASRNRFEFGADAHGQ